MVVRGEVVPEDIAAFLWPQEVADAGAQTDFAPAVEHRSDEQGGNFVIRVENVDDIVVGVSDGG